MWYQVLIILVPERWRQADLWDWLASYSILLGEFQDNMRSCSLPILPPKNGNEVDLWLPDAHTHVHLYFPISHPRMPWHAVKMLQWERHDL